MVEGIAPETRDACGELVSALRELASEKNREGMARYGINVETAFGVSVYDVRRLAKGLRDHSLAQCLWETGLHEARMLSAFIDDPPSVTADQMEDWAAGFDSWDLTDQVTTSETTHSKRPALMLIAWVVVGGPLLYGLVETIRKTTTLFG